MKSIVLFNNAVVKLRPESSVPIKNGAVAERVAKLLGGQVCDITEKTGDKYLIPIDAVHEPDARKHGATGTDDVYGGIVKELEHADKAILHSLVSPYALRPAWYSRTFAKKVSKVVLPGFTVFSYEDAVAAFEAMQANGLAARFKDPTGTAERGQYVVQSREELDDIASNFGEAFIETGAVLETDLRNASTLTAGIVLMAGQRYSWLGNPYDTYHKGLKRFGGNELTVVRGGFDVLAKRCDDPRQKQAIQQISQVHEAYASIGASISRATFDVVQGVGSNGLFLSGVTDPSLRPSASSPAEIRAIEAFAEHPNASTITSRVDYDYAKNGPLNKGQELFVGHSCMNIFVEIVAIA